MEKGEMFCWFDHWLQYIAGQRLRADLIFVLINLRKIAIIKSQRLTIYYKSMHDRRLIKANTGSKFKVSIVEILLAFQSTNIHIKGKWSNFIYVWFEINYVFDLITS